MEQKHHLAEPCKNHKAQNHEIVNVCGFKPLYLEAGFQVEMYVSDIDIMSENFPKQVKYKFLKKSHQVPSKRNKTNLYLDSLLWAAEQKQSEVLNEAKEKNDYVQINNSKTEGRFFNRNKR